MFKRSSGAYSWLDGCAYQDIDTLPVYNWDKVSRTNDLKFLLKVPFAEELTEEEVGKLSELWDVLQQQYIDEFGLPSGYKINLKKRKKIVSLQLKGIITGDRHYFTQAGYLMKQMQMTEANRHKPNKLAELAILVGKHSGAGRVNTKEWSVLEFYTALKMIEKQANGKN